jgi:hypothetical protein
MKRFTLILTALMLVQLCFSQNYLARARSGKEWGYINTEGKWVVNPQFGHVNDFNEGLAAVEKEGQWGFIDKAGNFKINPQFDVA